MSTFAVKAVLKGGSTVVTEVEADEEEGVRAALEARYGDVESVDLL